MKKSERMISFLAAASLALGLMAACSSEKTSTPETASQAAATTFALGDTTFNPENEEPDVNPHNAYSGWACIRYGIGETLFHYSDSMEIEPWLATGYEQVDALTWKITLRDGVTFSSSRALDGQAVKECLEHLVEVHDRARGDLKIDTITADGQTVTITTRQPCPTLLNYLSDPYGCIIDMEAGITEDGIVCGTGPYVVDAMTAGKELDLVKNETYWKAEPGYDKVSVVTIPDGDTLTLALQSGEIDGAYGMPYASYPLFRNEDYTFSSCATSRAFFVDMNFESEILQDSAVRQAIAMGIDKERFVENLLDGNGYPAAGVYPDSFSFGGDAVTAKPYDPERAKKILEDAGWVDTDGDGIREKNGKNLTIRWLTYPSRQELPLLAEAAQATLGAIGFEVVIQNTADHREITREQAREKALVLFEKLHLPNGPRIWDSHPFELSGGMNQRVGIAAAMLMEPPVLLADEPTSALDVTAQKQVIGELLHLRQMFHTAMILVTHDIGVVSAMADTILVLKEGRIMECGPANQVLGQPQDPYTRQLLAAVPRLQRT